MRNLLVLRDSMCVVNSDAAHGSPSELARVCADSDTGNVYVADVTLGNVYCLSSNNQVGSCVDPRAHSQGLVVLNINGALSAPSNLTLLSCPASAGPSFGNPAEPLRRWT